MGPPCPTLMTRLLVATSSVELADRWMVITYLQWWRDTQTMWQHVWARFYWPARVTGTWSRTTSREIVWVKQWCSQATNSTVQCFCPSLCSTGSETSTATLAQVGQKEAGVSRVSKAGVTEISSDREWWTPQHVRGKQPHDPDKQVTSWLVPLKREFRGHKSASNKPWKPRSQCQLQSGMQRIRVGFVLQCFSWRSGNPGGIEWGGQLMQKTSVYVMCIFICVHICKVYFGKHSNVREESITETWEQLCYANFQVCVGIGVGNRDPGTVVWH